MVCIAVHLRVIKDYAFRPTNQTSQFLTSQQSQRRRHSCHKSQGSRRGRQCRPPRRTPGNAAAPVVRSAGGYASSRSAHPRTHLGTQGNE